MIVTRYRFVVYNINVVPNFIFFVNITFLFQLMLHFTMNEACLAKQHAGINGNNLTSQLFKANDDYDIIYIMEMQKSKCVHTHSYKYIKSSVLQLIACCRRYICIKILSL